MNIPRQLCGGDFRFVLIKPKAKIPFEKDWQNTANYPWSHEKIKNHGGNVGILTGVGGVIIFDCDCQMAERLARQLPSTLVVGTSTTNDGYRKKHFYFSCPLKEKKILNDHETHLGEIQAKGQQCIVPPSIHPSGSKYEILEDQTIAAITEKELLKAISPFVKQETEVGRKTDIETDPICARIKENITVPILLKEYGFDTDKNPTKCLWHESQGGQCFSFSDDVWHCFHCEKAGSVFHLMMEHEKISFNEAKEKLAKRIDIKPKKGATKNEKEEKKKEIPMLETATEIIQTVLNLPATQFMIFNKGTKEIKYAASVENGEDTLYPNMDDGVTENAILLPDKAEEYGSIDTLLEEIIQHIHKYVDVSAPFERVCAYYVLLSWVFDKVDTMPYLRVMGDTGTGKTRVLDVVGRLCYYACMVSGAITPAPIYRMIKKWRGSLIIDEADFKKSDTYNEVIKILNCGFERGRPVLRCVKDDPDNLQYLPTFSPKVIATRFEFTDKALEARCITEQMDETNRDDIPEKLGSQFKKEEQALRNKLLMFRLNEHERINSDVAGVFKIKEIEPRLRQMLSPFAVFAEIPGLKKHIEDFAHERQNQLIESRAGSIEGEVVATILKLHEGNDFITTRDIVDEINNERAEKNKVNVRWIGRYIKSLNLVMKPQKVDGKTKRCLIWDKNIIEKLTRRYVPKVTTVTSVTSRGGDRGNDVTSRGKGLQNLAGYNKPDGLPVVVTNVTNVTEYLKKWRENGSKTLPKTSLLCSIGSEGVERLLELGLIYEPTPGMFKPV